MDTPWQIPEAYERGKCLPVCDPLDGSSSSSSSSSSSNSNIDVNVSVGSIFSILRAPADANDSGRVVVEADLLQPGAQQVVAG